MWPTCPGGGGAARFLFAELTEFYRANGAGALCPAPGFPVEDGALCPVEQPDCPGATRCWAMSSSGTGSSPIPGMLEGNLVNNVLPYGDSGTGKSATVKNLLTPARLLRPCASSRCRRRGWLICPGSSGTLGGGG